MSIIICAHVSSCTQSVKLNEFEYIIIYLLYTFYWSGDETINLSKPDDHMHIQTNSKDYFLNTMEPWRKMIPCLKGQANSA